MSTLSLAGAAMPTLSTMNLTGARDGTINSVHNYGINSDEMSGSVSLLSGVLVKCLLRMCVHHFHSTSWSTSRRCAVSPVESNIF